MHAALNTACRHPVPVHRGDLAEDLSRVAADAPTDATLVVYHTAVLAYVDANARRAFAAAVRDLGAVWLSNEASGVVPVSAEPPAGAREDSFVLIRNGRDLLASADPHGTWIDWAQPAR